MIIGCKKYHLPAKKISYCFPIATVQNEKLATIVSSKDQAVIKL